jgi:putative transposase
MGRALRGVKGTLVERPSSQPACRDQLLQPLLRLQHKPEIISLLVKICDGLPRSLRSVEELPERGIEIGIESLRLWWNRFDPMLATGILRRRVDQMRSLPHWRWHLDEVLVKINGLKHYLWRAVDHEGEILEIYVTKRRDRKSALKFLRKSMTRHGQPKVIVTAKHRSYGAALKDLGLPDDRETGRWLNNRAENSHQPFRRRERAMLRFRRMRTLQNVRIRPRLGPQSLQPGAQSLPPTGLQAEPHRRSRGVASTLRSIRGRPPDPS